MQSEIDAFLATLDGDLEPIRELALRLGFGDSNNTTDELALSHRPRIAPLAYAIRLFKPLPPTALARYQQLCGIAIAPRYLQVIQKLNGTHAFQFSLFGVPPSMASNPPLLDRSVSQPYDLGTANQHWKLGYAVPRNWFHLGGGPYSYEENIGYFLDDEGSIHASRTNGERLRSWTTFRQFLTDELASAEARYPAHEAMMAEVMQNTQAKKPRRKRPFSR